MNEVKIGRKIAEARKNRNLTQQQLADALFVTNKTVSRWECGNNLPDTSILVALCEQLGISVGQLLEDEDSIGNAVANDVTASQEENAKELQEISIIIPPIEEQRKFLTLVRQSDKSKLLNKNLMLMMRRRKPDEY